MHFGNVLFIPALKGQPQTSPGQRPGTNHKPARGNALGDIRQHKNVLALKGRDNSARGTPGDELGATMKRRALIKRCILIAVLSFPVLIVVYLLLLCFPGPFFSYEFRHGRIVVRSDLPIPLTAESVLRESERRLALSPFYEPTVERRLYVCNRSWRFLLFANVRYRVGGLTYPPLSNNIFLRSADFDKDRLTSASGIKVPGVRSLSYFIAHEIAHAMIADHVGSFAYVRLPDWKNEGYCDYVAKGGAFSFDDELRKLRAGDPELDPARSGLYLRYHLLVAYLLDKKGVSPRELLERDFDSSTIERELLAYEVAPPASP